MTEPIAGTGGSGGSGNESTASLRWHTYLQRCAEPLFFLNRRRRLIFANRAWEELTGVSFRDARGQAFRRRVLAPDAGFLEILQSVLAPPPEAVSGKVARIRRAVPAGVEDEAAQTGRRWWDITFLPLSGATELVGILGKITPLASEKAVGKQVLPENILALRERFLQGFSLENIVAESLAMQRVVEQVRLASRERIGVSLVGEAGAGKRWLARCIHQQSDRREGTFVGVDCLRLPQQALAEAMFGEGGVARRRHLGTLYLHEPAQLPREIQERLLQLLTGWTQADQGGPAAVAGFSCAPEEEARAGQLLPALQICLSTLVISIPPLRQRTEDLPRLLEMLLERALVGAAKDSAVLSDAAQALLRNYPWPGNLAELYRVLLDACLRAEGPSIEERDLPFYVRSVPPPAARSLPLDSLLETVERRLMMLALRRVGNNKTQAAELLSIWRQRLIRRMAALGLETPGDSNQQA